MVSIHLVLSEHTTAFAGASELALMKPGAYLINTSRGPIVDETALIAALKAPAIGHARFCGFSCEVVDVFAVRSRANACAPFSAQSARAFSP